MPTVMLYTFGVLALSMGIMSKITEILMRSCVRSRWQLMTLALAASSFTLQTTSIVTGTSVCWASWAWEGLSKASQAVAVGASYGAIHHWKNIPLQPVTDCMADATLREKMQVDGAKAEQQLQDQRKQAAQELQDQRKQAAQELQDQRKQMEKEFERERRETEERHQKALKKAKDDCDPCVQTAVCADATSALSERLSQVMAPESCPPEGAGDELARARESLDELARAREALDELARARESLAARERTIRRLAGQKHDLLKGNARQPGPPHDAVCPPPNDAPRTDCDTAWNATTRKLADCDTALNAARSSAESLVDKTRKERDDCNAELNVTRSGAVKLREKTRKGMKCLAGIAHMQNNLTQWEKFAHSNQESFVGCNNDLRALRIEKDTLVRACDENLRKANDKTTEQKQQLEKASALLMICQQKSTGGNTVDFLTAIVAGTFISGLASMPNSCMSLFKMAGSNPLVSSWLSGVVTTVVAT